MTEDVAGLEGRTRALLASDRLTAPTRAALSGRMAAVEHGQGVLNARQLGTLGMVARELLPLGALHERLQLARRLDQAVADGPGDGWRYADAPPDDEALRRGLDALEAAAGPGGFGALAADGRSDLLHRVHAGELAGAPAHWFEDVLAALARLAYAHPLLQVAIGYDGMADAHGFQDLDASLR